MKMGTTPSRFPYDAAARDALQLASLRCSAIQHYASWISGYCETVRLPLNTRRLEQFADRREGPAADVGYPERSTQGDALTLALSRSRKARPRWLWCGEL